MNCKPWNLIIETWLRALRVSRENVMLPGRRLKTLSRRSAVLRSGSARLGAKRGKPTKRSKNLHLWWRRRTLTGTAPSAGSNTSLPPLKPSQSNCGSSAQATKTNLMRKSPRYACSTNHRRNTCESSLPWRSMPPEHAAPRLRSSNVP
eukprot:Rmarinus@m.7334